MSAVVYGYSYQKIDSIIQTLVDRLDINSDLNNSVEKIVEELNNIHNKYNISLPYSEYKSIRLELYKEISHNKNFAYEFVIHSDKNYNIVKLTRSDDGMYTCSIFVHRYIIIDSDTTESEHKEEPKNVIENNITLLNNDTIGASIRNISISIINDLTLATVDNSEDLRDQLFKELKILLGSKILDYNPSYKYIGDIEYDKHFSVSLVMCNGIRVDIDLYSKISDPFSTGLKHLNPWVEYTIDLTSYKGGV